MTKQQEWERRLKEQALSGLTPRAWCQRRGVSEQTFHYWQKRLGKATEKSNDFVQIGGKEPLELVLREGVRIRIPQGFDSADVKRLVEALGC